MFEALLKQAATFADKAVAEPTTISGIGVRQGIIDRMSAERLLKRGEFGGASEGTITVVYARSVFTPAQVQMLPRCTVQVASAADPKPLAIASVDQDATWVTITATVR